MPIRFFFQFLILCSFASAGATTAQVRDFLLGPGDVISVKVFENPALSVEARVSEAGVISYPLIGDLPVAGITASATGALIAKRLQEGGFVKQPYVNVGIAQLRSVLVSVLGQVTRPGRYPMEQSASRVTDVLAIAGGALPAADEVVWLVTHEGDKARRIEVDVAAVMRSGDMSKNMIVKNGDTLFVPRAPNFYIYGEAQRPGQYRVERGMNAMQALAVGGGPSTRGTDSGMRLSRRDASGKLTTRVVEPNEPILPDDILYVRERVF